MDGDFAVRESELQPVLNTLVKGNFAVVAIHKHMSTEQPRYVFLHYWGVGSTHKIATTLHEALNLTHQH